ncbi:MAG: nitroreductase family protein [Nitrospirae bacterium]|nr:MAG: nitroreductase family protein [Nitrospirota bacterium]
MSGSLFRKRYSCRRFLPDPIPRATVERLLDAARWAPTAGGLEPWRFVVVTDPGVRSALARAAHGQRFLAQAPVVVCVVAVPAESAATYGRRGAELYCLQDTAAATQNLLLAAAAEGLGTCWVGAFDEAAVARLLSLPAGWRPVALVPVGRPDEGPGPRRRRPLETIVTWIEGDAP